MNDDESKDKNLDNTDMNNTDDHNSAFDDLKDFDSDDKSQQAPRENFIQKSSTDIELERVESIENTPLADKSTSDDKDEEDDEAVERVGDSEVPEEEADDHSKDEEKAEKPSDSEMKAGALPVIHPEDNKKKVSLDDIIKTQSTEKKAEKKPLVWIILAVLFFMVAAGIGVMYYLSLSQHSDQQDNLQASVESEKAKNASLNKQLVASQESLAEKVAEEEKAAEIAKDGQYLSIPEWGVQYKQDESNSNLTYSYGLYTVGQTEVERLSFSTTDISSIKETTGPSVSYPCTSSNAPVGWIDRFSVEEFEAVKKSVQGTPMEKAYDDPSLVNKDGYYFMTGTPQNACSDQLNQTDYNAKLKTVQELPAKFVPIPQS